MGAPSIKFSVFPGLAAVLMLLPGCGYVQLAEERDRNRELVQELRTLRSGQKTMEKEVERAELNLQKYKLETEQELLQARSRVKAAEDAAAEAERELEQRTREYEEYRNRYRSSAAGRKLDTLETVSGRVFEDVTLQEITDLGLAATHAKGAIRLPPEELGPEWHDEFRFDLEKGARMAAQLKVGLRAREREIAKVLSEQKAAREAEEKKRTASRKGANQSAIAKLESDIAAAQRRISVIEDQLATQAKRVRDRGESQFTSEETRIVKDLQRERDLLKAAVQEARARITSLRRQGSTGLFEGNRE